MSRIPEVFQDIIDFDRETDAIRRDVAAVPSIPIEYGHVIRTRRKTRHTLTRHAELYMKPSGSGF